MSATRMINLIVCLSVLILAACNDTATPQEIPTPTVVLQQFTSKAGNFTVSFPVPGTPVSKDETVQMLDGKHLSHTTTLNLNDVQYMASYTDYQQSDITNVPLGKFYDQTRNSTGTISSTNDIQFAGLAGLAGFSGREEIYNDKGRQIKMHSFLFGTRLYRISVSTPLPTFSQTDEAFINSFNLLALP